MDAEDLAREKARRDLEASYKARGWKHCGGCKEWYPPNQFYGPGSRYCKVCCKEKQKERYKTRKLDYGTGERLSGGVESYIGQVEPAKPTDALKYACMDVGFHHRPIPRGQSKREAYCTRCTAKRCMHHRELTPKELVAEWKKWGK